MFVSNVLNAILEHELAAGNRVAEEGPPIGKMTRLIILVKPFQTSLPSGVAHMDVREVNDPHWWKTEIEDLQTREVLACRF